MMDYFIESRKLNNIESSKPMVPLQKGHLCKVWNLQGQNVRILKVGSDFCDNFTNFNNISINEMDIETKEEIMDSSLKHRK